MRSKLAADPGAPWIQETVARLLPWERPKIRPCGDKLIISKYSHGGELASASLFPKTHAQVRGLGENVYEHWIASGRNWMKVQWQVRQHVADQALRPPESAADGRQAIKPWRTAANLSVFFDVSLFFTSMQGEHVPPHPSTILPGSATAARDGD
ncbi:hypothetical protein HMH01_17130 [Halovulum dunhuangense]|uniref:Uncharacterized protein n=1 Tax=Halovulum dunhuangense TaxID=1505036 RepID=A0A849L7C3_9RHOB|nr:hypothetical protein [Halovulum dunhuangense]NNU82163.1 hypothetical protein [Halovulum dunhuangense]